MGFSAPIMPPDADLYSRDIKKENPSIYDLAPTILKIIGFDDRKLKQCNFDGTPLF